MPTSVYICHLITMNSLPFCPFILVFKSFSNALLFWDFQSILGLLGGLSTEVFEKLTPHYEGLTCAVPRKAFSILLQINSLPIITSNIPSVLALLRQYHFAIMHLFTVTLFKVEVIKFWTASAALLPWSLEKYLVHSSQIFVDGLSGFSLLKLFVWADFNDF